MTKEKRRWTWFSRVLGLTPVTGDWVVVMADGRGGFELEPVAAWAILQQWPVADDEAEFTKLASCPPAGAERIVVPLLPEDAGPELVDRVGKGANYSYCTELALGVIRRDCLTPDRRDEYAKRSVALAHQIDEHVHA